MSLRLVPVEQARAVAIRHLAPGSTFSLWWDRASGRHEREVRGVLLSVHGDGYARVRIRYDDSEQEVEFKDASGKDRSFTSHKTETVEWSAGTLVIEEENEMAKEATKSAALKVKDAPAAKGPKVPENDCLCGCGEKVFNRFKPGHDARYYSQLKKVVAGDLTFGKLSKAAQKVLGNNAGVKKELDAHFKPKPAKTNVAESPNKGGGKKGGALAPAPDEVDEE